MIIWMVRERVGSWPVRRLGCYWAAERFTGLLADLGTADYDGLRADLIAAESIGVKPKLFDPLLSPLRGTGTAAAGLRGRLSRPPPFIGIAGSSSRFRAVSRETG
jgi:hypothetical protein